MGWASAGRIFDPVAKTVIEAVESGDMYSGTGVAILETLARNLSHGDWDTWDESLRELKDHPLVVSAFKRADLLACEDPDSRWDHEDCHSSLECKAK